MGAKFLLKFAMISISLSLWFHTRESAFFQLFRRSKKLILPKNQNEKAIEMRGDFYISQNRFTTLHSKEDVLLCPHDDALILLNHMIGLQAEAEAMQDSSQADLQIQINLTL